MNLDVTPDLFGDATEPWIAYKPRITQIKGEPNACIWDVPYTIPQLGYLTHNHFRYYGKFPSVIAGQILDDLPPSSENDFVLDNFCGSGTTLVEARIRGIAAVGVDVSWLGALASNVKVSEVDFTEVRDIAKRVAEATANHGKHDLVPNKFRDKWFSLESAKILTSMQDALTREKHCPERDFCLTAFLAIIRRVSFAYDGEVRPHINKDKTPREPLSAFLKKVSDMILRHREFLSICTRPSTATCIVADNKNIPRDALPRADSIQVRSYPACSR